MGRDRGSGRGSEGCDAGAVAASPSSHTEPEDDCSDAEPRRDTCARMAAVSVVVHRGVALPLRALTPNGDGSFTWSSGTRLLPLLLLLLRVDASEPVPPGL